MEIDHDIILTGEELDMIDCALEYYANVANSDEELQIIDNINQKIVDTLNGS